MRCFLQQRTSGEIIFGSVVESYAYTAVLQLCGVCLSGVYVCVERCVETFVTNILQLMMLMLWVLNIGDDEFW